MTYEGKVKFKMANVLTVIEPYWYQGTWVFDDESAGLDKEPFVQGVPEMIDELVKKTIAHPTVV